MTQIIETLFSALESTVQSEAEAKAMAEVDAIVQSRICTGSGPPHRRCSEPTSWTAFPRGFGWGCS